MASPESMLGQVLGGSYRLEQLITEGGASLVFEAECTRPPRREVVVKLLHPALQYDHIRSARFQHEAEVLGQLRHRNAVQLLDRGTAGDLPYVVLELLRGETLRGRLERGGPLAACEAGPLLQQAAAALQVLHDLGVVHRDVRPENLFLTNRADPELKLLDFGLSLQISHQRQEPEVVGRAGYISPEQFRGEVHETDGASDLFALAVVAHEMLCGQRPFQAEDDEELLRQVCSGSFTPLSTRVESLAPQVDAVLSRALHRDKQQRHRSIETFADELREALDREPLLPREQPEQRQPEPAVPAGARMPGAPTAEPRPSLPAGGARLPNAPAVEPGPAAMPGIAAAATKVAPAGARIPAGVLPPPVLDLPLPGEHQRQPQDPLLGGLTLMDPPSAAPLVGQDTTIGGPPAHVLEPGDSAAGQTPPKTAPPVQAMPPVESAPPVEPAPPVQSAPPVQAMPQVQAMPPVQPAAPVQSAPPGQAMPQVQAMPPAQPAAPVESAPQVGSPSSYVAPRPPGPGAQPTLQGISTMTPSRSPSKTLPIAIAVGGTLVLLVLLVLLYVFVFR